MGRNKVEFRKSASENWSVLLDCLTAIITSFTSSSFTSSSFLFAHCRHKLEHKKVVTHKGELLGKRPGYRLLGLPVVGLRALCVQKHVILLIVPLYIVDAAVI